jgi:uncharacterized cysteine cluster protein YcgN (CxxCxxCC family)
MHAAKTCFTQTIIERVCGGGGGGCVHHCMKQDKQSKYYNHTKDFKILET